MNTLIFDGFYELLQKYASIPSGEWKMFTGIFHKQCLKKEEYFIKSGEKPFKIGFVVSGVLRLFYLSDSGNEYNKSFCIENDFVASYSALLRNEASRLNIQALENSTLLLANYKDYSKLLDGHFCWQMVAKKIAEDLFIKKEQRESQFLLENAETRYANFLVEYPGLDKRIKQYQIASYLGITPVALSRIRKKINSGC